jgi:hypothetical protein
MYGLMNCPTACMRVHRGFFSTLPHNPATGINNTLKVIISDSKYYEILKNYYRVIALLSEV